MKSKKIIKIISINIISIIIFIVILEISAAIKNYYDFWNFKVNPSEKNKYSIIDHIKRRYIQNTYFNTNEFRKPIEIKKSESSSIVLLGCSFTYGSNLKDNETFGYQLSQYTHKNVYNLGLSGSGPREILYIIRNKQFIENKTQANNIEYVIYTYIGDHQLRLYANLRPLIPEYKIINNKKLEQKKDYKLINKSFAKNAIMRFLFDKFYYKKSFNTFVVYANEINKEIKKNFSYNLKPAKLIILVYSPWDNENWELLSSEDIIVIKVEDLIGKYIDNDPEFLTFDNHPNAKAWEIIVPALTKKLNL